MHRILFFVAIACLAASRSNLCLAQDHATGGSNKLSREEWQSRVNAARERLDQRREELRLEREKRLGPKQEELRLNREGLGELSQSGTSCGASAKTKASSRHLPRWKVPLIQLASACLLRIRRAYRLA